MVEFNDIAIQVIRCDTNIAIYNIYCATLKATTGTYKVSFEAYKSFCFDP